MSSAPAAPKYGLGIVDFNGFFGHNGGIEGFQSFMGYQPETGTTVIMLTNIPTAPDGTLPVDDLAGLIIQHLKS
jgi:D-alanyl-D-alanine carboxypeptidase